MSKRREEGGSPLDRPLGAVAASAPYTRSFGPPKTPSMREIHHFVGGASVASPSGRFGDLFNADAGETAVEGGLAGDA